jgi:pilus assembly protein CpaB
MDSRKVILLVGALIVAAITAFFARSLIMGSAAPQAAAAPAPVPMGPEVLVATRSLPVGTILDPTALKYQPWPKDLIEGAYYQKDTSDMQALIGTVVRNPISAGQPLTQGALVKPGDRGFLAAALGPGMRAVTVPVSSQSSVAGFIFPGDRVDMMLTQTVAGGGDGPPLKASETIMRNLRVLATDQSTSSGKDEAGNTIVRSFSLVTLEVTPKIAEQIQVAQTLGSLSMSLRSIADSQSELQSALASGATTPDGKPAKPGDPISTPVVMQVAGAPQSGPISYATGGDVSRFQRRTVPGGGPAAVVPGAAKVPTVRIARQNSVTEVSVGGK